MGRWFGNLGKLLRGDNKWTLTWEMTLRLSGDSKKEAGRSELDPDMMMEAG